MLDIPEAQPGINRRDDGTWDNLSDLCQTVNNPGTHGLESMKPVENNASYAPTYPGTFPAPQAKSFSFGNRFGGGGPLPVMSGSVYQHSWSSPAAMPLASGGVPGMVAPVSCGGSSYSTVFPVMTTTAGFGASNDILSGTPALNGMEDGAIGYSTTGSSAASVLVNRGLHGMDAPPAWATRSADFMDFNTVPQDVDSSTYPRSSGDLGYALNGGSSQRVSDFASATSSVRNDFYDTDFVVSGDVPSFAGFQDIQHP